MKILLAVDGSEHALRAARHVANLAARLAEPLTVLLLNVQAPVASGLVRRFLSQEALDGYYREEAQGALDPAQAVLAAAACRSSRTWWWARWPQRSPNLPPATPAMTS